MKKYYITFEAYGTWTEAVEADSMSMAVEAADNILIDLTIPRHTQLIGSVVKIEEI